MTPEQRARMCEAMVATSAQLARLLQRMHKLANSAKYDPGGKVDSHPGWSIGELDPPSRLLEGMPKNRALSGATSRVLGVQTRLLLAATSKTEIDPLWVCRVLQALGDEFSVEYSPLVKRMAEISGAELPDEPRKLHHGLGLREVIYPGEWKPEAPCRSIQGLGE